MQLELFLNFDGNCREAAEFYAKVFKSRVNNLMTYADAPPDPGNPVAQADLEKILYAGVPIGGMTVMLMDMPAGEPLTVGNNITPTYSTADKDEIVRLFGELKEGGTVYVEPSQAFFSELYCMVQDKFGVIWQLLHWVPQG